MAPWSISDKVDGVFDDGHYLFQVAKVSYSQPKEGTEHGRMMIRLKVVSEGAHQEEMTTQGFPLDPKFIGILAGFLQGTGSFDPTEKSMPDDEEALTAYVRERIDGNIYEADYAVEEVKGRKFGRVTILGPYSANA